LSPLSYEQRNFKNLLTIPLLSTQASPLRLASSISNMDRETKRQSVADNTQKDITYRYEVSSLQNRTSENAQRDYISAYGKSQNDVISPTAVHLISRVSTDPSNSVHSDLPSCMGPSPNLSVSGSLSRNHTSAESDSSPYFESSTPLMPYSLSKPHPTGETNSSEACASNATGMVCSVLPEPNRSRWRQTFGPSHGTDQTALENVSLKAPQRAFKNSSRDQFGAVGDDDDICSSSDEENGMIAIGIPDKIQSRAKEKMQQSNISQTIAEELARQEHEAKLKKNQLPAKAIVTRRVTERKLGASKDPLSQNPMIGEKDHVLQPGSVVARAGSESHRTIMEEKSLARGTPTRELSLMPGAFRATTRSDLDQKSAERGVVRPISSSSRNMKARRLNRLNGRQNHQIEASVNEDDQRRLTHSYSSSDESAVLLLPIRTKSSDSIKSDVDSSNHSTRARARSRFHRMRQKSMDSSAHSSDGSTVVPASIRDLVSLRSMEETTKLQRHDSGPSLAPATSGCVVPGATEFIAAVRHEKENGPSLAPARAIRISGECNVEGSKQSVKIYGPVLASGFVPDQVALTPGMMDLTGQECYPDEDEDDTIEAQAGLPVLIPGAFAIEGMESSHTATSRHNSVVDTQSFSEAEEVYGEIEEDQADTEIFLEPSPDDTPPLVAELHEEVVVDGAVLEEHGEDDPKQRHRLRLFQAMAFFCSVVAVTLIAVSVSGVFQPDQAGPQKTAPKISGWLAAGEELFGSTEEPQVLFGTSIGMSGDGFILAVSSPGWDNSSTELNVGQVQVFSGADTFNGTQWDNVVTLEGPGSSEDEKTSIAMSSDGRRLVVGYPSFNSGTVQVFEDRGRGWSPYGGVERMERDGENIWFGHAVDISADGDVLAVGAPLRNSLAGEQSGAVRVFRSSNTRWIQIGSDILGESMNDFVGWSLALNSQDGSRVAVGGPVARDERGIVRIYDWDGSTWKQIGETLTGINILSRFGSSVSLSGNGQVLAIGARGTAFEPGEVRVYREIDNAWVTDNIFSGLEPSEGFGTTVSLSKDGNVLAIGIPQNNEFGNGSGSVQVWKYYDDQKAWKQEGTNIGGSEGSAFGSAVALSADGFRVGVGSPLATFDGSVANVGSTIVYDRVEDNEI
jgi:hypothetical protein